MSPEFLDERDKKILELSARKKIYNIVKKFAGCHFREIERISRLPTGMVKYHLDYLAKHGLVSQIKEGNNLRYFPRDFNSENKKLMSLLRQKSVRQILLFVLVHNNCSHQQIANYVKLSPSTVSWHLKKLKEYGIIGFTRKGRSSNFNILSNKEEIINLLITYQESLLDSLVDRVIEMWDVEF
ncbi:MAG: winged helix-turn-helix transcriptional regulator [Nanoarchaeota archaeon]|nr:winged helix-turn-helix transcriptional regulator [Nanoarchaeota archaeon]